MNPYHLTTASREFLRAEVAKRRAASAAMRAARSVPAFDSIEFNAALDRCAQVQADLARVIRTDYRNQE